MGSLSIGYSTRALFGITKQQSKEGLSGDCWRKGRFEVHVLLRLFANEHGGLALDTKARRPAWRFFARVEAVASCSSGLCLLRLPIEMTSPALYSK